MDIQQILDVIPRLDPEQLDQIVTRAKGARSLSGGREPPRSRKAVEADDWLLPAFEWELNRRGFKMPLTAELVKKFSPSYALSSAKMRAALLGHMQVELKPNERGALGRIVVAALAHYLDHRRQWSKYPDRVGVRPMLQGVTQILDAVEFSFPGYMRAGLLRFVLRAQIHG